MLKNITWKEHVDIEDIELEKWLANIPSIEKVGFKHRPDKEAEYRIIGYDGDNIVVYGFLGKNISFGYVVHPDYRNYGLGHGIMNKVIEMAKLNGKEELVSEVFSHNLPSIKLMMDARFTFYGPIYLVKKVL